jgi:hypothetical protein
MGVLNIVLLKLSSVTNFEIVFGQEKMHEISLKQITGRAW